MRENSDEHNFMCMRCACEYLGYGKEFCEMHGNEFIDFKCMYCCSIALFVSEGGRQYDCEPCIHNALEKNRRVITDCTGGLSCPLAIWRHPKASKDVMESKFALGCSLCRSDKLSELVLRPNKNLGSGVNLE